MNIDFVLTLYAAAVAGLAVFGLHRLCLLLLYARVRRSVPPPAAAVDDEATPRVTVQLPLYNERYVATRLVLATARLDHPRDRLRVQVLDDSSDDTTARLERLIRRLRRMGYDIEHVRRPQRTGFKAGALEFGLQRTDTDFVAVFDADFVPAPDFLRRTLPHFADPAVGMVQSRWGHLNRECSLLTRLQAVFLDGHFHVEHVARNRTGRFFNFNGTAGVWRRQAIVEAGGWEHDTLTEDLDLSYRAQMHGWRFVYLDDVVSPAELPEDMNAFKAQQHRWAKGSAQTALKLLVRVLRAPLPLPVKIEAALHLTSNFTYVLMTGPVLLWVPTLASGVADDDPRMLLLAGTMGATTTFVLAYYLTGQRAAGQRVWVTVCELPAMLALGIGMSVNNARAVLEALAGHQSPFLRTPKSGGHGDGTAAGSFDRFAYRLRARWHTWLELLLAGYFVFGLVVAARAEKWVALPFLLLFLFGFLYVGLGSLGRRTDGLLRVGSVVAGVAMLGALIWVSTEMLARWP
ncbi:MAG TPA: cellulose synthase family protein [Candidatus Krumholzibacteria bacterium]|nr:cellulose synthase family protein [Candidatus Krumholzibacteria bacterium]